MQPLVAELHVICVKEDSTVRAGLQAGRMCWLDASCLLPLRVSARLLCFARSGAHEHELQASTSACEYLLALPDFPLKLTPPSSSSPPACLPVVVVVVVVL